MALRNLEDLAPSLTNQSKVPQNTNIGNFNGLRNFQKVGLNGLEQSRRLFFAIFDLLSLDLKVANGIILAHAFADGSSVWRNAILISCVIFSSDFINASPPKMLRILKLAYCNSQKIQVKQAHATLALRPSISLNELNILNGLWHDLGKEGGLVLGKL